MADRIASQAATEVIRSDLSVIYATIRLSDLLRGVLITQNLIVNCY
jgi:hypothetical protein